MLSCSLFLFFNLSFDPNISNSDLLTAFTQSREGNNMADIDNCTGHCDPRWPIGLSNGSYVDLNIFGFLCCLQPLSGWDICKAHNAARSPDQDLDSWHLNIPQEYLFSIYSDLFCTTLSKGIEAVQTALCVFISPMAEVGILFFCISSQDKMTAKDLHSLECDRCYTISKGQCLHFTEKCSVEI